MNLNHRRRRRCARRHHRKRVINFSETPNAIAATINYRLTIVAPGLTSIRFEAIHRGPFRRRFLITRGKDPRSLTFGTSARNAGVSLVERITAVPSSSRSYEPDVIEGAPPLHAARTRVRCGPGLSALSRY
jgi:hypothetical protein